MNLKMILSLPYPHGMASTRRVHNHAKGIIEYGNSVKLLIIRPTERTSDSARNTAIKGTYEGVDFEYTCGVTTRPNSFIKLLLVRIRGVLVATAALVKQRKNIDAILIMTDSILFNVYFFLLTRVLRIIYVQEKNEIPFFDTTPRNILQRVYQYLYKRYIFKLPDGILVISNPLWEFFKTRIRKKARLLLVPIIVDPEEFVNERNRQKNTEELSIVLCGTLTQKKEGVLTLIRAFNKVSDKFNNLTLYLIGGVRGDEDELKSRELVKELGLENKVVFTGYVSRERLRQLMCNASALALAKPSSPQADYCFPSKLAEYLATGNPVVVTNTGEISLYLRDGVNAFVTEPDSETAFARKLEFVLSNPKLAQDVGRRGQKVALDTFDYKIQSKRIINFIQELKSKRS